MTKQLTAFYQEHQPITEGVKNINRLNISPSEPPTNQQLLSIIKKISNIQDNISRIQTELFHRVNKLEKNLQRQENIMVMLVNDLDERLKTEIELENSIEIQ